MVDGTELSATSISAKGDLIDVSFKGAAEATLKVSETPDFLIFEVLSASGKGLEELAFLDIPLIFDAETEGFCATVLALNLRTNVPDLPGCPGRIRVHLGNSIDVYPKGLAGPLRRITARCYRRFGFSGARAALIAAPRTKAREIMKVVVSQYSELPSSRLGGPWALDAEETRGSYLFNFGGLGEKTVEEWIRLAEQLGLDEIDFHGGRSFRFGDFMLDPETYPEGVKSIKRVIEKLHRRGILAGLHTYSFFIDKSCPWVTPRPDGRLAKQASFTLAADVDSSTGSIPVVESTAGVSTKTGFFVRNSVTIQIEDELIVFKEVSRSPPYGFLGCHRGAYGTRASHHAKGAKVHHLKECFGLFVPDPESTLFDEVAQRTAELFNEAGFDMIYFDALDGEDVLAGRENGWHYGSKFVFEVVRNLKRPAIIEMSTFHHHLWYVRSRIGAWDHPTRGHRRFIDLHCSVNEDSERIFLPAHLGWWAFKAWSGPDVEPTFPEDVEYLCCKCIGYDCGLSIMGVDPDALRTKPFFRRLAEIVRKYETLRRQGYFPPSIKKQLRVPGATFTLARDSNGRDRLRRVFYHSHKAVASDERSLQWTVNNPFQRQRLGMRIMVLTGAEGYDHRSSKTILDFDDVDFLDRREANQGVSLEVTAGSGWSGDSVVFSAQNSTTVKSGAWAVIGRTFSPPKDLGDNRGIGVWVKGDGGGELVNIQLTSPKNVSHGIGEHYIDVNFSGWRYFELIEPEGERYSDFLWPYGDPYSIYRESVDFRSIERVSIWYNDIPPGQKVSCEVSRIKALPLKKCRISEPSVSVGNRTIAFPVDLETGSYLECTPSGKVEVFSAEGELVEELTAKGGVPTIPRGRCRLTFDCRSDQACRPRVLIVLRTLGPML